VNVIEKRQAYETFLKKSKGIFRKFHGSGPENLKLRNIYAFCIAPGSASGGIDTRILEVFYGSRPANSYPVIQGFRVNRKIVIEYGARLQYFQLDDGNVMVSIIPARTDNMGPIEDEIIIDYIGNVKKISNYHYVRKHWEYFIAYMNQTCLAGRKTIKSRIMGLILHTCKENVIAKKINQRKIVVAAKRIFQFALSIGLSGFLLFFIANYNSSSDAKKMDDYYRKIIANQVNEAETFKAANMLISDTMQLMKEQIKNEEYEIEQLNIIRKNGLNK